MQNNFDEILARLTNRLRELFVKFFDPHLRRNDNVGQGLQRDIEYLLTTADGDLYRVDVEAYSVLAHAAFEDYFEKIALETVKKSVEKWKNTQQVNDTLLLLVAYMLSSGGEKNEEENEEIKPKQKPSNKLDLKADHKTIAKIGLEEVIKKSTNHIDKLVKNAQTYFHNVLGKNNGIELKFLIKVLIPVALDISEEGYNSIKSLATNRGEAAHNTTILSRGQIVRDIPTPLAIFQNDKLIFKFCQELCVQAKNKF